MNFLKVPLRLERTGIKTWALTVFISGLIGIVVLGIPPARQAFAQQPTGSIPTVTGTPSGPMATVYTNFSQVRVYAGPSSYTYPPVGILLAGQQVPALGKTADGEWILVMYMGIPSKQAWVYAPYVSASSGKLPIVEPPPLPTPRTTPTIDPTLAAAFPAEGTSARLPTYTPPPTISVPTFIEESNFAIGRFPIGMIIFGLIFLGFFGAIIALTRGR